MENNKQFGQCFLNNEMILQQISKITNIENKNVVEIGPGNGALTRYLYKLQYKTLTLCEIDTRFIHTLCQEFTNNVIIINDNCLNINIQTNIIISNLPYCISSNFCFNLITKYIWNECVLMLQYEFVKKLQCTNNTLGIAFNILYDLRVIRNVSRNNFTPKPAVESTIIHIRHKNTTYDAISVVNFCKELCSYNRKKLPAKYKKYANMRLHELNIQQIIEMYEQR